MEIINKIVLVCYYFWCYLDEEDEVYEEQSVEQVN
jgi:hypothetical protein